MPDLLLANSSLTFVNQVLTRTGGRTLPQVCSAGRHIELEEVLCSILPKDPQLHTPIPATLPQPDRRSFLKLRFEQGTA